MPNKYGVPVNHSGKIPCRCNKCLKRKSLARYPEEYSRDCFRTCDCGGTFRVDAFRLRAKFNKKLQEIDSGKMCKCSGHPKIHRYGKKGEIYCCLYHDDYELEQALKGNRQIETKDGEIPF